MSGLQIANDILLGKGRQRSVLAQAAYYWRQAGRAANKRSAGSLRDAQIKRDIAYAQLKGEKLPNYANIGKAKYIDVLGQKVRIPSSVSDVDSWRASIDAGMFNERARRAAEKGLSTITDKPMPGDLAASVKTNRDQLARVRRSYRDEVKNTGLVDGKLRRPRKTAVKTYNNFLGAIRTSLGKANFPINAHTQQARERFQAVQKSIGEESWDTRNFFLD